MSPNNCSHGSAQAMLLPALHAEVSQMNQTGRVGLHSCHHSLFLQTSIMVGNIHSPEAYKHAILKLNHYVTGRKKYTELITQYFSTPFLF